MTPLPAVLSQWPEEARHMLTERAGMMYGAKELTHMERARVVNVVRRMWADYAMETTCPPK